MVGGKYPSSTFVKKRKKCQGSDRQLLSLMSLDPGEYVLGFQCSTGARYDPAQRSLRPLKYWIVETRPPARRRRQFAPLLDHGGQFRPQAAARFPEVAAYPGCISVPRSNCFLRPTIR